jgi:hypothetical protein
MTIEATYLEIQHRINDGSIFSLSRVTLARYVAALSQTHAYSHFGGSQFPHVVETVRLALALKAGEEASAQAQRECRIALIISVAALAAGVIQAAASIWQLLPSSAPGSIAPPGSPAPVASMAASGARK